MRQSEAACEGKICGDYVFKVISALERCYVIRKKMSLGSYARHLYPQSPKISLRMPQLYSLKARTSCSVYLLRI